MRIPLFFELSKIAYEAVVERGIMENPEKTAALLDRNVVYADVEPVELIFIPKRQAERLCNLWHAATTAKTWGELRSMLVPGEIDEIVWFLVESYDDDWKPIGETVFDGEMLYGGDGDWPDWPQQDMLDWVPPEIQVEYGEQTRSFVSGPCLVFDSSHETDVVDAFRRSGFTVVRDDDLVKRACGFGWLT